MFLCQSHLNDFVNCMKTKHSNIKFTSKFEKNGSSSFLDLEITRRDDVFTNFQNFLAVAYKFALVYTLLHRFFLYVLHRKIS